MRDKNESLISFLLSMLGFVLLALYTIASWLYTGAAFIEHLGS